MNTLNFEHLWLRKSWLFGGAITAIVIGWLYLNVTEPTYEVESRVMIEHRGLSATGSLESASRYREFLTTQGEILGSEKIVAPVLAATEEWKHLSAEERQSFLNATLENFEVATIVNTDVLRLRYRGDNPEFAVTLVDGVLTEYDSFIRDADKNRYGGTLEVLERSEQDLRSQLVERGEQLSDSRARNGLVGTGRDMVNVQISALNDLRSRLSETRRSRVELQIKLGSMKSNPHPGRQQGETSLVSHEPFTPNTFPRIRNNASNEPTEARGAYDVVREQWRAKANFDEISTRFGPRHPAYQSAKEALEEWTQFTEHHNETLIEMLENEVTAALEAESQLQELFDAEYERIKKLDKDLLEEQQLTSEIARIKAAHAIALDRLRDFKMTGEHIDQGKSSTNVVILTEPTLPEAPIWPLPVPFLAMCGLFGGLFSSLAALYL